MSNDRKALLVIDVQNDFLPPNGSLAVNGGNEIIQPILSLIEKEDWDMVIMTQDWHSMDHTSFAQNHENVADFESVKYNSPVVGDTREQDVVVWPVHCVQNTKGSEFHTDLKSVLLDRPDIVVLKKGYLKDREYYSAFNDIWNDHKTELNDLLQDNNIKEVYIVGIALDYCVKDTAISASQLGYKTTVLKDYCRAIDTSQTAMANLTENFKIHNITLT
ncbi:hypothetical protein TPHA_0F00510 [Tetrapisispora phaffii CBS 4417]|uniref:nicotinamidase n=1 Tax=Tetrapisispora phaffii (strain ATCC 24235 / CBS 4417 / NBRC 1672 / NRRL Y-8282 / UCD 70-5) TaxID=1071381 RepID=G8BUV6_TETPH|nr:hypothetical protein TPHA_0F00510 [Tetrapisispora phaffii CBS 4417]CCE63538.1 hypothetical protein TPHA_0F00510 [Tetrapisispora phaffii CBS 4417]